MEEIKDLLGQKYPSLFYFNRCTAIEKHELIGDAFDSEDTVTVWVGPPPTPEEGDEREDRRSEPKSIMNKSRYKIIVEAQTKNGSKIFLEENQLKAVKFDSWTWNEKIKLYRYLCSTFRVSNKDHNFI